MASKSLGTLTIDLVARTGGFVAGMDKAERNSAKWRKQVEQDAKVVGTAFGAGATAAIAGLAALTVSTVKSAAEISRFSAISGAGVEEFQRYAKAAEVVGISQEKLSDQLKDFNEKVGEFQQSGGGGMKDFFEQIAPQIGITADAFKGLSGPQGLQLYYDSLEKAGVSQDQMSFYLESMASDTTALIPLLRDGGAGFKLMGDAAAAAGAIMDTETIRAANELSAATTLLKMTADGASNQIMEAMLPALSDMAAEISGVTAEGEIFTGVGEGMVSILKFVASRAVDTLAAFQILGKGIAGVAFIASEIPNGFDAVSRAAGMVGDSIEDTTTKAAEMIDRINQAGESGSTNPKIAAIADILGETSRAAKSGGAAISEASKKAAESIAQQVAALELQAATAGMSADQAELYKLSQEGATEADLRRAEAALKVVGALDAQSEASEKQQQANADALSIIESLQTEEEAIKASYEKRRKQILASTIHTEEEKNEAIRRLQEEHDEQMLEANGSYWERYLQATEENLQSFDELSGVMLDNFTGRFGDAFESMVFDAESFGDAISGLAEGMARSVVNALGQMAAQWIAYHAVQLMLGKSSEATAIASAAITGTSIAAAYAPAAAMASLASFGANSAPAMAGITSTVGLSQTIALAGMAHDGIDSVPQTGTWLLEKGERVTTAETSAKLDKTLSDIQQGGGGSAPIINVIGNQQKAGTTDAQQQDGRWVIDVFVADVMGDGRAQKAISQKFGIQGVGR